MCLLILPSERQQELSEQTMEVALPRLNREFRIPETLLSSAFELVL